MASAFDSVTTRANGGTVTADWWNALKTAGSNDFSAISYGGGYSNNEQLDSDDLPNTTTVYGYNLDGTSDYDDGDFVGSKALTETGTGLTAGADVLGTTVYNTFNGSDDYLTKTDDDWQNFDSGFTVACWVYRSSWAAIGTNETIMASYNSGASNGWMLILENTNDEIQFRQYDSGLTAYVGAGFTDLSSGWHHIAAVWDDTSSLLKLYIDGLMVASAPDSTLTAVTVLDIGAYDSAVSADWFFAGRLDEIVIHQAQEYTDDQIARLYCRSAQIPCFLRVDSAGNDKLVFKSPMEGQQIKSFPIISDAAAFTTLYGSDPGFDTLVCRYRVWPHRIQGVFSADVLNALGSVNSYLSVRAPIGTSDNPYKKICGRGIWDDDSASKEYPVDVQIINSHFRFYLADTSGTYVERIALEDTKPAAWANNDSIQFSFSYEF